MTGGTGMGRVTLASAGAMVVLMIAATGVAAAKPPPPTPVTATIQAKPHPQVYCEECIRLSGRVSSPKAVCRANRTLESATAYKAGSPAAGKVYRDPHFLDTDGQGKWSVVTGSGEPLAWFEVIVPKKRIGSVICQAARAKVTL
jgi:hypothetical protein